MEKELKKNEFKQIYKAIYNAKNLFKPINFDMKVSYNSTKYEYATYNKVVDCISDSIFKNSLLIIHDCDENTFDMRIEETRKKDRYGKDGILESSSVFQLLKVKTRIIHVESGEELQITIPYWFEMGTNGLHSLGGALTYLKRYGITTLLGIQAEKDNDANNAEMNDDIQPIKSTPRVNQNKPRTEVTASDFETKIKPVLLKNGTQEAAISWFKKQIETRNDLFFNDAVKKLASNAIKNHFSPKAQPESDIAGFKEQQPAWIENCINDFHLAKNVNALLDVRAYFENDIAKLPKNTPLYNRVISEFKSAMNVLESNKEPLHDNVIPFNKGVKQQDDCDPRGWENDPVFNCYGNRG